MPANPENASSGGGRFWGGLWDWNFTGRIEVNRRGEGSPHVVARKNGGGDPLANPREVASRGGETARGLRKRSWADDRGVAQQINCRGRLGKSHPYYYGLKTGSFRLFRAVSARYREIVALPTCLDTANGNRAWKLSRLSASCGATRESPQPGEPAAARCVSKRGPVVLAVRSPPGSASA